VLTLYGTGGRAIELPEVNFASEANALTVSIWTLATGLSGGANFLLPGA